MPVPADARPSARRALIALIAAEAISALGSLMSAVALPWFVLATTGSPTRMGLVLAAESAPVLVLAVPSARAVARLGARGSLVACDAWWAAATAAVPVLHFAGGLSFGTLLALAFLAGVPWAAHVGSQGAAVAEMLDADERAVARASALLQTLSRLAYFAGPALGGVLLAAAGAPVVLLIDAGTFVVSLALVAAFVPRAARPRAGAERAARGAGGWRHLWRDPWLRSVTAAQALSQAAFMGMTSAIPVLAFIAADHDPRTAGALLGAWGGGAMAGSLAALRAAPAAAPLRIASRAWAFQAAGLWVLVADRSPAVAAGALAVSG